MSRQKTAAKPWYREPWPWLLAAGPVIVVFAALYTYYLAAERNKPSMVTDDYYREGKNIGLELRRDEEAQQRGIGADVLISPSGDRAKILLNGRVGAEEALKLTLLHPARSEHDQTVPLARQGGAAPSGNQIEYTARFKALPPAHHWYVRVEDEAGKWRVQGRWETSQGNSLKLEPMHQAASAPQPE